MLEEAQNTDQSFGFNLEDLRTKLFILERKQEKLEKLLAKKDPVFLQLKYQNKGIAFDTIKADLGKKATHLVEYFWGDSAVYVISISGTGSKFIKILRTTEFNKAFDGFIRDFSLPAVPPPSDPLAYELSMFKLYTKRAFYLYTTLVKPVWPTGQHNFSNKDSTTPKMIIIPDGPLVNLPFHALISSVPSVKEINYKDLSYLIYQLNISRAYSANLLFRNQKESNAIEKSAVLAFGFSSASHFPVLNSLGTQHELPGSGRELKNIAEALPGKFFVGKEATEQNFKKYAAYYRILHLAIHANAKIENQMESRLIFKPDKTGKEDGFLYPYELHELNLKARLVVLSACETGTGRLNTGEGVYSMARGFAYAGCPASVMSLWKVDDNITADLMSIFYQGLSTGLRIDDALHQAQIKYLQVEDEFAAHPRFWATFVPIGDMSPPFILVLLRLFFSD